MQTPPPRKDEVSQNFLAEPICKLFTSLIHKAQLAVSVPHPISETIALTVGLAMGALRHG